MNILITGASGQLGRELMESWATATPREEVGQAEGVVSRDPVDKQPTVQPSIIGLNRHELDVTDAAQVSALVRKISPDLIIHCAAWTAVDQAESKADLAYQVNALGTRNVAVAAEQMGARMCYISTDYVFDGKSVTPYKEYDATNPLTVYGKSKLAGEMLVQSLCSRYYIVRTSWLYGRYGHNFVHTMLRLADIRESIRVVDDQTGSPTCTADLAEFLRVLTATERYGIYHATNSGSCTWYEFAKAIFECRQLAVRLEPCTTADFPRPAPRPSYSVLDHMAIRAEGFSDLRPWREALEHYLMTGEGQSR